MSQKESEKKSLFDHLSSAKAKRVLVITAIVVGTLAGAGLLLKIVNFTMSNFKNLQKTMKG
jgi:hypothetical protein